MRLQKPALLAAAFVAASVATSPADELTTAGNKKTPGKLVAVDAKGVTFSANGTEVKVPAKDVLAVDLGNKVVSTPGAKYDEVELTDGSAVRCARVLIKGKTFDPTPLPGPAGVVTPTFEVPLTAVFSLLRGADEARSRDEWKKMLAGRGKRDLYVIRQADGLNFLPGTLIEGNEAGDAVVFEREDGQRSNLRLSRASGGLVFNQPPQAVLPPTLCKVVDVFGNTLFAQSVELAGAGMKVKTVAGATVTYPSLQGVAKLDYAQGNITYLSDLEPEVTAPESDPLEPRYTWRRDKNQLSEPLRLDGATFAKGLWVYADTTLTFPIGDDFREFKAVVGTDESITNGSTQVRLTVEADGRVVYAGTFKRTDKPKALNLDVKGVKQLKLTVEADVPYNGNQLVLAEARVQK